MTITLEMWIDGKLAKEITVAQHRRKQYIDKLKQQYRGLMTHKPWILIEQRPSKMNKPGFEIKRDKRPRTQRLAA